jgi:hypothetical protein
MRETVRGAAAVAPGVKFTGFFRTAVFSIGSKKCQRRMVPNRPVRVGQDIAEQEFLVPEEEIAGIHGSVGKDPELRGARGTSNLRKFGIMHAIGKKAGAEDRTDVRRVDLFFYDRYESVKGNASVKVLASEGVTID